VKLAHRALRSIEIRLGSGRAQEKESIMPKFIPAKAFTWLGISLGVLLIVLSALVLYYSTALNNGRPALVIGWYFWSFILVRFVRRDRFYENIGRRIFLLGLLWVAISYKFYFQNFPIDFESAPNQQALERHI
jgi:hypothetical protein